MPATRTPSAIGSATTRAAVALLVVLGLILVVVGLRDGGGSYRDVGSLPESQRVAVATPLAASTITGVDAPSAGITTTDVKDLGLREDNSLDVPSDAESIGWYDRSASPGTVGPTVLAGHVNLHGENGTFARLKDMTAGDTVEVHREDGTTAVFRVDRVGQFSKDAFPTDTVYGPTSEPEIRLITCGGVFDRAKRSYDDNVVVFGTLVEAYRAA